MPQQLRWHRVSQSRYRLIVPIPPVGRGTYDLLPLLKLALKNGYTGPIGFQGYGIKGERKAILAETMEGWKKMKAAQ